MPPGSRPSDQCSEPGSRGGVGTASACSLSVHGWGREGPGRRDTARRVWRQPPRPPAGTPADSRERWPLRHCRRGPWSRWQRRLQPRPAFRAGGAAAAAASGGGAPTPFRWALSHLGRPRARSSWWPLGAWPGLCWKPERAPRRGCQGGDRWAALVLPPPPPSSAPHKGPHSRLILGGEAEVPTLGHDLQRSAQCTPPLSPPDLCWPWGQHTTPRLGPSKELSLRSCSGHGEFTDRQRPVLWPSGDWKLDSWPLAATSSWKTSWRWLLSLDLRKL